MATIIYVQLTQDRRTIEGQLYARVVPEGGSLILPLEQGGQLHVNARGWAISWPNASSATWAFARPKSSVGGKKPLIGPDGETFLVINAGADGTKAFRLVGLTRDPQAAGLWVTHSHSGRKIYASPGEPEAGQSAVVFFIGDEVTIESLPAKPDDRPSDPADEGDPFV